MEDENRFIMLIDDNDITLESVSEALQLHGFQTICLMIHIEQSPPTTPHSTP